MIDPNTTTTIRVGELPLEPFNLTDNIPHEIGTELKRGTIQQLSDFIASVIDVSGGVGFRAISVTDGQTLPTTTQQEFILVGKGTYFNVAGGSTLILNEELNAIVSNGSFWFVGVEIPINVELAGITQFIREGFITTTPSEDAVFNALQGIDLSAKEDVANKQNSLAVDGTNLKYPTVTAVNSGLALKANLASPTFTGTPTVPTAAAGTNTTQIATTAFVLANSSNIPQLESNATDLTVWNNGKGNIATNTSFGDGAGISNISGANLTVIGNNAGFASTGNNQTFIGAAAGKNSSSTNDNTMIGASSGFWNTTGSNNTIIGRSAGTQLSNNSNATNIMSSVIIGANAKLLADGQTNQIVIGNDAIGAGSNTATLGNTTITSTILRGAVSGGSFIKSSAPSTNLLLAGGGDIAQSSFIGGTGTTNNFLPKFIAIGTVGNSMVFDNGTNIGIGTNNPVSAKLQLTSTSTTLATAYIYNSNSAAGTSRGIYVEGGTNSSDYSAIFAKANGSVIMSLKGDSNVEINSLSGTAQRIVTANASGQLSATTIPVFADNTAAIAGGLGVGALYRTVIGLLAIVF